MKPAPTDPEAPQIIDARKRRMDHYWRRGNIGDAAYILSLRILGYLPKDAETELNLLKMDRR